MISESCRGNYRGNVRAWHGIITHDPLLQPTNPAVEAIVIANVIVVVFVFFIVIALDSVISWSLSLSLRPPANTNISCNRSERNVMSLENRRITTYFETHPAQHVPFNHSPVLPTTPRAPPYWTLHYISMFQYKEKNHLAGWVTNYKPKGEETRILTVS